jgi:hypothetical protein
MGLARIKPASHNCGSTCFLMVSRRLWLCWERRDDPGKVGWARALEAILHGDNFGPIAVGNGMHLQIEDQGQVNKEVGGLEGADFFPDEGLVEGILGQEIRRAFQVPTNPEHEGPAGEWLRYLTPETEIEHRSDTQIRRGDPAVRGPVDAGQGGRQRSHDQERRQNIVADVIPVPEQNEPR